MSKGFGLIPLKEEDRPAHPDAYGIGYDSGHKFSDEDYLRQLRAYAEWRGIEETKKTMCSKLDLLDQI